MKTAPRRPEVLKYIHILTLALGVSGCAISPTVPFYDRHSIMEEESAADWPDYTSNLSKRSINPGTSFLQKPTEENKDKKALIWLNADN